MLWLLSLPFFSIILAKTNNHVNSQFGESRAKIYSDIVEGNVIWYKQSGKYYVYKKILIKLFI